VFTIEMDGAPRRFQVADGGVSHKTRQWKLVPVEAGGLGGFTSSSPARMYSIPVDRVREKSTKNPPNPQNPPAIPRLPAYAQWHNADHDEPVTVVRVLGERDGVMYLAIAGSQTGIPAHEVEFFEEAA
jgi:hypothetical protein